MSKQQVRYIVKRNYSTSRTGTDAFIKLIKNDKSRNKSPDISQNNNTSIVIQDSIPTVLDKCKS